MRILLVALFAVVLIAAAILLYLRRRQPPVACAKCGAPSRFGYSTEAESRLEDIVRLCFNCLAAQLSDDYQRCRAKALVIQPVAGFPCYVFRTKTILADSGFAREIGDMLAKMAENCSQCAGEAHYLWLTSNGLDLENFEQVLSKGPSQTLLQWGNSRPISLCGKCCATLVTKTMQDRGLTFFEVCSPRSEDGAVVPMAY